MSHQSKHHRVDSVDHVIVSQGSRNDAKPASPPKFETYTEEREHFVYLLKDLESRLSGYSKAAFSSAQYKIRNEYRHDADLSFSKWMLKKSSMERERQDLVSRKRGIETEVLRLKPLVKAENARITQLSEASRTESKIAAKETRDSQQDSLVYVATEGLLELRKIRVLLEQIESSTGDPK